MTSLEELLADVDRRRAAWPWWKKVWMWLRWRVFQPVDRFPGRAKNVWQRSHRGWGFQDLWGMDHYLAEVNIGMLVEFRRIAHGNPVGLGTDSIASWADEEVHETVRTQIAAIDAQIGYSGPLEDGFARWMAMLVYFEEGWRAYLRFADGWDNADREQWETLMPLYVHWYGGLWD